MTASGVRIISAVIAVSVASGCSSAPTPETHLYVLRDEPEPEFTGARGEGLPLLIARVDVAAHIDGITIARAGGKIDHLVYHRFAAPVAEMAARRLQSALEATGAFSRVLPPETQGWPDLLLRLQVRRLEIEDLPGRQPAAAAVLEGELTRRDSRAILWSGRTGATAPVAGPGVEGMVEALNEALGKAVQDLARAVARGKDGPPAPGSDGQD